MRYGINTWVWTSPLTNEELKAIAPKVAKIGFDWIEIPLEGLDDIDYAQAAAVIREYGLGISCTGALGPDRDLISPDPAIRENAKAYVRGAIDATQQLGATNLVGPFYSAVGRTWQQTEAERQSDLDLVVASLKELGAYAADHGVVICVEPLNRFETSFMNLASQVAEVVDRVDSPGVAMMLDTFHMNIEERNSGRCYPAGRQALEAHPHLRERPRRPRHRPGALGSSGARRSRILATTARWSLNRSPPKSRASPAPPPSGAPGRLRKLWQEGIINF